MARLWIKVMKRNRIIASETVSLDGREVQDALMEKLREMDLPSPLWLNKHFGEMEKFRLTSFSPGDFIELVRFDKIDISLIDENGEKRVSKDPRNEF